MAFDYCKLCVGLVTRPCIVNSEVLRPMMLCQASSHLQEGIFSGIGGIAEMAELEE